MTIKNDQRTVINLVGKVEFTQRKEIRNFLLDTWKAESPRMLYRYFVEKLENGKRVYIERPGRLNKGCDFVINIEDLILFKNGNDKPPKHNDLSDDLKMKATSNPKDFLLLQNLIERVYTCERLNKVLHDAERLSFTNGWSVEIVLKLVKWFFIEQDITYWNRTGRDMLWNGIKSI